MHTRIPSKYGEIKQKFRGYADLISWKGGKKNYAHETTREACCSNMKSHREQVSVIQLSRGLLRDDCALVQH